MIPVKRNGKTPLKDVLIDKPISEIEREFVPILPETCFKMGGVWEPNVINKALSLFNIPEEQRTSHIGGCRVMNPITVKKIEKKSTKLGMGYWRFRGYIYYKDRGSIMFLDKFPDFPIRSMEESYGSHWYGEY